MDLYLLPDDPRSRAAQIYDQIREAITDGRLSPGARLAPTRTVAADLGVARSTVTDAYGRLTAEGFLAGRRGGGTIVVADAAPRPPDHPAPAALAPTPHAASIRPYRNESSAPVRYDLSPGRVDAALFPMADWRRCLMRALSTTGERNDRYGQPLGSPELRLALAHWVAQSRGIITTPQQVVATQGTGQAVDLLARVLLRPGDVAAVEEPGYPPVTNVLRSQGIEVVGIPVDEHGIVVAALPARTRLVYVTPSHQYPLGVVLSRTRRLELLRWAGETGAAIVEDDYDSEFRYYPRPLEPLHRLDRDGRVVYVASLSKTLSPALRIGFAIVPIGLVPAMTAIRQAVDFCPPTVIDAAMTTFIEEGHLARHVRRARRAYVERHRVVWREVSRLAGPAVKPLPTHAGLHLTVMAPQAPPYDELLIRAADRKLQIAPLHHTYQFGEPRPGVVVGFGALATSDAPTAISLLGECLT